MSIEYKVSQNGKRIDAFPKGVLDINQTNNYFERLKNDSSLKPNVIEIVDFNEITDFKISFHESQNITQS